MAEKSAKKKPKKSAKASSGSSVLGNLPSSRPTRIGGERRAAAVRPTATKAPKAPAAKAKKPSAPKTKAAPKVTPPPVAERPRDGRPSTTEVVTTAVQAAGELGKIGLTVGRQVLKRATSRIPRP